MLSVVLLLPWKVQSRHKVVAPRPGFKRTDLVAMLGSRFAHTKTDRGLWSLLHRIGLNFSILLEEGVKPIIESVIVPKKKLINPVLRGGNSSRIKTPICLMEFGIDKPLEDTVTVKHLCETSEDINCSCD